MNEEVCFPRGGVIDHSSEKKSLGSSQIKKRKGNLHPKDFLFVSKRLGTTDVTVLKKKRKKISANQSKVITPLSSVPMGGGEVFQPNSSIGNQQALIKPILFHKLAKGSKLLGIVREVTHSFAVMSLPNMLTGFVQRGNSRKKKKPRLDRVISVGMVLPVIVIRISSEEGHTKHHETPKRRIELSISPSQINQDLDYSSLYEGMIVRGRIRSVENHGCLVDISVAGVDSCQGCFLKYQNVEEDYVIIDYDDEEYNVNEEISERQKFDNKVKLNQWRIYDFEILYLPVKKTSESSFSPVIQLKLPSSLNRSNILTHLSSLPALKMRMLMPGMLVSTYVEHYARNGLCVTFLGNRFRGAIDSGNLGGYIRDDSLITTNGSSGRDIMWWKEVFVDKLRSVTARLIFVDHVTKVIRLSLLPHILRLHAPDMNYFPSVGSIIENVKVLRYDPGVGALLALPPKFDNMNIVDKKSETIFTNLLSNKIYQTASTVKCAYVHISKALDPNQGKMINNNTLGALFGKLYSLRTVIPKLRILSTKNWVDNVASCATSESIVSLPVLTHHDLVPGAIYEAVPIISTLKGGGILVQLGGMGVKGVVPSTHLFDQALDTITASNTYKKRLQMDVYKVGKLVDLRCLFVSPEKKQCTLTAKKSLLNDTEDPITNYQSVRVGQKATGFITRVSKSGLIVTFYNNIYGKISVRKLADELAIDDPTDEYKIGDVVKVCVIKCIRKVAKENDNSNDISNEHMNFFFLELSLNLSQNPSQNNISPSSLSISSFPCTSGCVLPRDSMKIVKIVKSRTTSNNRTIIPGHAIISVNSKYLSFHTNGEHGNIDCYIPFHQILDSYTLEEISSEVFIDALLNRLLEGGETIHQEGLVLTSYSNGVSHCLPTVSLKPELIEIVKENLSAAATEGMFKNFILPNLSSSLFIGAYVCGYCVRVDPRYGAFIRFLDDFTGLVPKVKGGLDINIYDTVKCKVIAVDITSEKVPKILLTRVSHCNTRIRKQNNTKNSKNVSTLFQPGSCVGEGRIDEISFSRVSVTLLNRKYQDPQVKSRIHITLAYVECDNAQTEMPLLKPICEELNKYKERISTYHPFYSWNVGDIISDLYCVSSQVRDHITYVELTNHSFDSHRKKTERSFNGLGKKQFIPYNFVENSRDLKPGLSISVTIMSISPQKEGLWVQICPGVDGFIPGIELTEDVDVLNNMNKYYVEGARIHCCVIVNRMNKENTKSAIHLSVVMWKNRTLHGNRKLKPETGNLIIGQIKRSLKAPSSPALMLQLRDNYYGRCDITELEEVGEWINLPLGRELLQKGDDEKKNYKMVENVYDDEFRGINIAKDIKSISFPSNSGSKFIDNKYVHCRVLSSRIFSHFLVEVSLRQSRIDGKLEDDVIPEENDIVHAYVISTNRKGCFLRLSRKVEGRAVLKYLSESFLPNPMALFPSGRLVLGRVKHVREVNVSTAKKHSKNTGLKVIVDLDLRESNLLDNQNYLTFDDVKVGEQYSGLITRVESFGVFVCIQNSNVVGLAHVSECSDDFITNLLSLYDPGDIIKVLVIKCDQASKRLYLSLKSNHFESCDDSNNKSSDKEKKILRTDMMKKFDSENEDNNYDYNITNTTPTICINTLSKNQANKYGNDYSDSDRKEVDNSNNIMSKSKIFSKNANYFEKSTLIMDSNVGFDWGINLKREEKENSLDDYNTSDSDNSRCVDMGNISTPERRKIRIIKKRVARLQEENIISCLEARMADGTADDTPETSEEFERVLATNPNSSEYWIKYMAFYLSLVDVDSARNVANRALNRIEFGLEGEKLNIWTSLFVLELKYGTPKSLDNTMERASRRTNPKHLYLRICEILEKEVIILKTDDIKMKDSAIKSADEMFDKMCKKFKTKKSVWIAHFKYLLKIGRKDAANKLVKRSLQSLSSYKHISTMSKYAQIEYEYGSIEHARTIFGTLIENNRKRLDLLFVFVDKEIKHGDVKFARSLFEKIVNHFDEDKNNTCYSKKHMKSIFKKWYRMEDCHGNDYTRESVKLTANNYVDKYILSGEK